MSLWDRNFQMAFWSIVFGCVTLFYDSSYMMENGGFFGGWTINTWILVFLWGIGGILVAITIKYTDVIIKGFASAISLILISIAGSALLGDDLDLIFGLGAIITIIATFNYNEQEPKAPSSSTPQTLNTKQGGRGENGSAPLDRPHENSRDMSTTGGSRTQTLDKAIEMANQNNVSVSIKYMNLMSIMNECIVELLNCCSSQISSSLFFVFCAFIMRRCL